MLKKSLFISIVLFILVASLLTAQTNQWRVNSAGQITLNGTPFRVKGGSWFGLEGRYEIPTDANNPRGAAMEMYMGNVFWATSSRTYDSDINEFKAMGLNAVRIPFVHQTLDNNDPQGKAAVLKNAENVRIDGARTALETVIKKCNSAGMYVLLDLHSCSNYVGWRKGRIDARPPWADKNRNNYDYKREDCSCSSTGNPSGVTRIQNYTEAMWLEDLRTAANFQSTLSVNNIMGIDIFNEPWDYSWAEWKALIDKAYNAINAVNTNTLIFAQGIGGSSGNQDGTPDTKTDTPYGTVNPNWGENLFEAGNNPPAMPKERLVYSPHTYGPSVCTQGFFADLNAQPECAGLQEDAFGDAKCQIVIDPAKLKVGWEEHFGYLKDLGYAICIGEFGGNMDWPNKAEKRHQDRYSYLTNKTSDSQWQNAFVNWLVDRGITDTFYWSINPESSDTYGLFKTPYDPINNTGGWGTWQGQDTTKLTMLKKIWNAPTKTPPSTITPTPTRTPTGTPSNTYKAGDANGDGTVNINDALVIAKKSAGQNPSPYYAVPADANCDGTVNINDALVVARYTAGLLPAPSCN